MSLVPCARAVRTAAAKALSPTSHPVRAENRQLTLRCYASPHPLTTSIPRTINAHYARDPDPSDPLRAILFDYGMVLSGPPNPSAWSRMRSLTTMDEERFHQGYWGHRHDYDSGKLTGHAYWELIAAEAGLPVPTPENLHALYDADTDLWTDLNLPMAEWAQSLQRAHIPTGILSNIGDQMEAGVLRKHPWLTAFTHITWSHRLATAKPDPAIYRHAAEGLAQSPFNILFIDDKLENIEAARNAGMQTIQYSTHEHFLEGMRHLGFASLLHDPPSLPGDLA